MAKVHDHAMRGERERRRRRRRGSEEIWKEKKGMQRVEQEKGKEM